MILPIYYQLVLDFEITHFYRIREEGGLGRPPTVHLRTDDLTEAYYTSS